MDAGGRATQDAQAEGEGGGEKFNSLFPPPLIPLPPREGILIFSQVSAFEIRFMFIVFQEPSPAVCR